MKQARRGSRGGASDGRDPRRCVLRALSIAAIAASPAACTPKHVTETVDAESAPTAEPRAVEVPDASEKEPIWIAPLLVSTPVMSAMALPGRHGRGVTEDGDKAYRIGYLRVGERVLARPDPRRGDNCQDGWYELVQGGFVCGKWIATDPRSPKVRGAPHPPRQDGPLPYIYGLNTGQGTPLYRNVPTHEDRTRLEPWRAPPSAKTPDDTEAANLSEATDPAEAPPSPSAAKGRDKTRDAGTPWYLREPDAGKLLITLDELRERGPVARRMVRGFYVSLDKKFLSGETTWWRTASGLIAPLDRIAIQKPRTDFHGVWVGARPASNPDAGAPRADSDQGGEDELADHRDAGTGAEPWIPPHAIEHLPVGIVVSSYGRKYDVDPNKQTASSRASAPRFTVVGLTGRTAEVHGHSFHETDDGWWMGDNEGVVPEPGPAPQDLGPGEKWLDVNISHQWLVALEGDKPVYVTLISSGKKDDNNKERDHRTITGSFRIREKHISATMDDDSATDGPYSIEDVPWIMYFKHSYALHGAFWHADFGYRKSHGCVNLAPYDAKALFGWADPQLPRGWHAVFATPERPGTRVIVHE